MATLLTNAKMSPALRSRVLASVRGEIGAGALRDSAPQGLRVLARVLVVTAFLGVGLFLYSGYRSYEQELASKKKNLSALALRRTQAVRHGARLSESSVGGLANELALRTFKDWEPPSKFGSAAFGESTFYARVPLARATPGQFQGAAAETKIDALALCFWSPPPALDEPSLYEHLGKVFAERADNSKLTTYAALDGFLKFEALGVERDIERARSPRELYLVEGMLNRVPFGEAGAALRSEFVLLVLDEGKAPGSFSEVDGATKHFVRVLLWVSRSRRSDSRCDFLWILRRSVRSAVLRSRNVSSIVVLED